MKYDRIKVREVSSVAQSRNAGKSGEKDASNERITAAAIPIREQRRGCARFVLLAERNRPAKLDETQQKSKYRCLKTRNPRVGTRGNVALIKAQAHWKGNFQ